MSCIAIIYDGGGGGGGTLRLEMLPKLKLCRGCYYEYDVVVAKAKRLNFEYVAKAKEHNYEHEVAKAKGLNCE